MEDKGLIYGRNPVMEYLKNAAPGQGGEVCLSEHAHGGIINAIKTEATAKKIPVTVKSKDYFRNLGPSSKHQGVALLMPSAAMKEDPDLLARAAEHRGVLVLLDQITDPHNAGAIIRTAEALGCSGIIMPKNNSAGITPAVIKASAGATAHIPVVTVANAAAFIENAKKAGFWVIGTSGQGDRSPEDVRHIRPALIVIGSEGAGMRRLTEEKCDYTVSIPLKGKVSSLNASVAAGIVLYELMK